MWKQFSLHLSESTMSWLLGAFKLINSIFKVSFPLIAGRVLTVAYLVSGKSCAFSVRPCTAPHVHLNYLCAQVVDYPLSIHGSHTCKSCKWRNFLSRQPSTSQHLCKPLCHLSIDPGWHLILFPSTWEACPQSLISFKLSWVYSTSFLHNFSLILPWFSHLIVFFHLITLHVCHMSSVWGLYYQTL